MRNKVFLVLIPLFLVFLFFFYKETNYTINYKINDFKITESYNKNNNLYKFTITKNDLKFSYQFNNKYSNQRKLIKDIKDDNYQEYYCIEVLSLDLNFYPLCEKDNNYYAKNNIINEKLEENISKEINGIKIYNLLNKKYLLWNYDSFVYLNDQIHKDINLFEKEFYKLELVLKMNNNLIIADYNDEYQFEQFFIIDANKGNVKDLKLKNEIYFDSYFLGYNKDSVYIVDRKNKQQYEINIKKRIQKKSNSKIYKNNKWENISINKLINKNYSFENEQNLIFFLENKNLYSKYNNTLEYVLLVNNVDKIVFINNMDVYYLKEDSLYNYNMYKGETKLMEYSEWLFNNDKMIYIFD